ncbi:hypothetical protein LZ554_000704 [Drepanopeziza brunnea f. sp. 'monogermtubi']|nr:hypothetical protein LZ554_000704 [Drepanopeziza brunnea f. sp. 'monogermtubi']
MGHQPFLMNPETTSQMYDGTSSDSSASSPMNCSGFESCLYGPASTGYMAMAYPTFPMQYPNPMGGGNSIMMPMGLGQLIPVELDMAIEGLYEDHDRRRKRNDGTGKTVSSHVHSRRRAQNRASQRAFRDRKEKHMRELEQRLGELEGRHSDLARSYASLQLEYANVKQELDMMRQDGGGGGGSSGHGSCSNQPSRKWDEEEEAQAEMLDPLFDVSAFCFDQEEDDGRQKD